MYLLPGSPETEPTCLKMTPTEGGVSLLYSLSSAVERSLVRVEGQVAQSISAGPYMAYTHCFDIATGLERVLKQNLVA